MSIFTRVLGSPTLVEEPQKYEITLRPETYNRLAELAKLAKRDISDLADEILATDLDEDDELTEEHDRRIRLGLCIFCGEKRCRGECYVDISHLRPVLVKFPKE